MKDSVLKLSLSDQIKQFGCLATQFFRRVDWGSSKSKALSPKPCTDYSTDLLELCFVLGTRDIDLYGRLWNEFQDVIKLSTSTKARGRTKQKDT